MLFNLLTESGPTQHGVTLVRDNQQSFLFPGSSDVLLIPRVRKTLAIH